MIGLLYNGPIKSNIQMAQISQESFKRIEGDQMIVLNYAGIGSRETPTIILKGMRNFATYMAEQGHTVSTGGAKGADSAFIDGAMQGNGSLRNYLPFPGYNGYRDNIMPFDQSKKVMDLAKKYHPAWNRCSPTARLMHARNCNIILGPHLIEPVAFILCWTPDGLVTGGTGQALRLAKDYMIPVCNLGKAKTMEEAFEMLQTLKEDIAHGIATMDLSLSGDFKLFGDYYE